MGEEGKEHDDSEQRGQRRDTFRQIWEAAHGRTIPEPFDLMPRATIPYMDEPWYC